LSNSYYNAPEPEGPGPIGYLALVLAWACPGLGHFILGYRARGIIFAAFIHGLFAAGLLIAGIRAINPPDQAIWTYTQFLTGWPMLVANRLEHNSRAEIAALHDEYLRDRPPADQPDQREAAAKDFIAKHPLFAHHPKVQDIGAVYCGIAGMLNLLVMFDVLLKITGSIREDPNALKKRRRPPAPAAPAPAASAPVPTAPPSTPTTPPSPPALPAAAPEVSP
jgi:hypothetical protein